MGACARTAPRHASNAGRRGPRAREIRYRHLRRQLMNRQINYVFRANGNVWLLRECSAKVSCRCRHTYEGDLDRQTARPREHVHTREQQWWRLRGQLCWKVGRGGGARAGAAGNQRHTAGTGGFVMLPSPLGEAIVVTSVEAGILSPRAEPSLEADGHGTVAEEGLLRRRRPVGELVRAGPERLYHRQHLTRRRQRRARKERERPHEHRHHPSTATASATINKDNSGRKACFFLPCVPVFSHLGFPQPSSEALRHHRTPGTNAGAVFRLTHALVRDRARPVIVAVTAGSHAQDMQKFLGCRRGRPPRAVRIRVKDKEGDQNFAAVGNLA